METTLGITGITKNKKKASSNKIHFPTKVPTYKGTPLFSSYSSECHEGSDDDDCMTFEEELDILSLMMNERCQMKKHRSNIQRILVRSFKDVSRAYGFD